MPRHTSRRTRRFGIRLGAERQYGSARLPKVWAHRTDGKSEPGKNRDRKNLSVKLSYDEGKTWMVNKVIEPGWSACSDLPATPQKTILCFYGRGRSATSSATT